MLALLLVLTACTVPDGSVAVDDAAPTPPRPDQAPGGLTASLVPPTTTTPGTLDPFCWASAPVQPPACAVVDPTLADCTATTEILRDGVPFLTDTRQFDPCGREWCSWQTLPDGSLHRAEERTWTADGLLLEIARDGGMLPATGQPSQLVLHAYDADDRPLSVTGNAFGAGDITWVYEDDDPWWDTRYSLFLSHTRTWDPLLGVPLEERAAPWPADGNDGHSITTFTHDALGRELLAETVVVGAFALDRTHTRETTWAGDLRASEVLTDADGIPERWTTWTHDPFDRPLTQHTEYADGSVDEEHTSWSCPGSPP